MVNPSRLKGNPYGKEMLNTIYKKYWRVCKQEQKWAGSVGSVDLYDAVMELIMIVFFVIWFVNMINTAADTVTDLKM